MSPSPPVHTSLAITRVEHALVDCIASAGPMLVRDGRVAITADGIPGVSEGLTLNEEAELMHSLGAVDAMNLDGGGSTQFASDGQLVDDPSSSPLRPVGDTIEVVP